MRRRRQNFFPVRPFRTRYTRFASYPLGRSFHHMNTTMFNQMTYHIRHYQNSRVRWGYS